MARAARSDKRIRGFTRERCRNGGRATDREPAGYVYERPLGARPAPTAGAHGRGVGKSNEARLHPAKPRGSHPLWPALEAGKTQDFRVVAAVADELEEIRRRNRAGLG